MRNCISLNEFGDYTEEERAAYAKEVRERAAQSGLTTGIYLLVSIDDSRTWTHTRLVRAGGAAYSALAYSRTDGHFYLLYEFGDTDPYQYGLSVTESDHEWLMQP